MALDLLVATLNPAKAERLQSLCDGPDVVFRSIDGAPPEIAETAASHLGNAIAKAVGWSKAYGGVTIASDGGLVIPALGDGWESTLTRRGTGAGEVPDHERARRLLRRMRDLTEARREAYWTEAIALGRDGQLVCAWEADGTAGRIGLEYDPPPTGPAGFWADALWETPAGKKRWQLTDAERGTILDPWATLAEPVRGLLARMC